MGKNDTPNKTQEDTSFKWSRKKFGVRSVVILLLMGLLGGMDYAGLFLIGRNDLVVYHEREVTVLRVVDGDTIIVDVADGKKEVTRVRFWGIDTPETAKAARGKMESKGGGIFLRMRRWRLQRRRVRGRKLCCY